jgi:EAL domain-containing protein (putative c-di-GMP-specific phosphodiesterase class I)
MSFFSQDPINAALELRDLNVLDMVRDALRRKDVLLAYQPIMRSDDPTVPAFYEGLLRVLDDTGRIIPAKDFIEVIETQPEGRVMDCLALEIGLKTLSEQPSLRLSINMSVRSIGNPSWEQVLRDGLAVDETVAERLIIEITESSVMESPDLIRRFMDRMHGLGVSFALDDFGAGYTAFRHFKDLYFDIVKIDRSFIKGIQSDADNQVLTKALLMIAEQFDMFVVAEGVEQVDEANYLIAAGVDCMQGYLFAAPMITPPWDPGRESMQMRA